MSGGGRRIVVIGAGPGGISSGHYLREAGYTDFTIFERADEVGGTWQRNRYPGLACDVWSHVYSFTFNLNPNWTRSYAAQPEILEYMRQTVTDLDLWPHIRLNTGVDSCRWDDDAEHWVVTTDAGEEVEADVVISGQGMFGELKYPDIEGRDSFEGVAMLVVYVAYQVAFLRSKGATPGRMMAGTRVETEPGSTVDRPDLGALVLRALVLAGPFYPQTFPVLGVFGYFLPLVAIVQAANDRWRQGLHDKGAHTVVVSRPR